MNRQPYEKLKFYQDICEIRKMTQKIANQIEKRNIRLASQMKDAARSAKQNIRESYRRGSLGLFLNGIRIAQGSLEELSGDIDDCLEDRLITNAEHDAFTKLFKSASYLSTQYIKSMSQTSNALRWKKPFKNTRP